MPTGTKVDKMYKALKKKGYSKGKSARIAQSKTGKALATGKPPKNASKKPMPMPMKRGAMSGFGSY